MRKRPIQIRDGVIHDPNVEHHPPDKKREPRRMPKFNEYAKLKTREELMKLAQRDF